MSWDTVLMDRIKVLGLDVELRLAGGARTAGGRYFFHSASASPLEQLHAAAWLGHRLSNGKLEPPQDEDDPNYTANAILETARELGIPVDFPPNKLKQGFGEHMIYILDRLSERALKDSGFEWKSLQVVQEHSSRDDDDDEGGDDADDDGVEEVDAGEDPPEEMYYSDGSEDGGPGFGNPADDDDDNEKFGGLAGQVDETLWRQEVEKAAPMLRVRVAPSARDWRAHLLQLAAHRQELGAMAAGAGDSLSRTGARAASALEAARARDAILAARLPAELTKLAQLKDKAEIAAQEYKAISVGVTNRQEILNSLTEKVEAVKQKTEIKGSAMNDASPVINIRNSVAALRKELQQMDLQLSVLMWSVADHQARALRPGTQANRTLG